MASPGIISTIGKIFRNPPIMASEDVAEYEQLKDLVIADVQPTDLREVALARDIVDAEWEILRLRGLKVGMLHAHIPHAVESELSPSSASDLFEVVRATRRYLIGILAGDPAAKEEFEEMLLKDDLTLNLVMAAAFAKTITPQLHTYRMASAAYERRNAAYAELERLRAKKGGAQAERLGEDELDLYEEDAPVTAPRDVGPADPLTRWMLRATSAPSLHHDLCGKD